jgi:hypothetical protein
MLAPLAVQCGSTTLSTVKIKIRLNKNLIRTVFVIAVTSGLLGGSLFVSEAAFGASTPANGAIKVFVLPTGSDNGTIVITGVIGDYGKTVTANAAGKPKKNGGYELLIMKKGNILVNSRQFNEATNNAQPTDFNATSCSGSILASAPAPIVSGTKAYTGITGSVTLTATFAFVGPFYTTGSKKGQCNTSNNGPMPPGFFATITGGGTVSLG